MVLKMKETAVRMLVLFFFCFGVVIGHGPHGINITAEPGQNVTLSCPVADYKSVTDVEWSKEDLPGDVLLYHNGKIDLSSQNSSFKNRVCQEIKDGNISLILVVKPGDNGTYKCRLVRERFEYEPTCIFQLEVISPGENDGRKEDGGKEDGGKKDRGKEGGGKEDGESDKDFIISAVAVIIYVLYIYRKIPHIFLFCINCQRPPAPPAGQPAELEMSLMPDKQDHVVLEAVVSQHN